MTQIAEQTGQPRPADDTTPRRFVPARRFTVRALRHALMRTDSAASITMVIMVALWATQTGPSWLTTASDWTLLLYAVAIVGTKAAIDFLTEFIISLVDPDRWDGDIAYEIAQGFTQLRTDIDNGADIDDVLDGLSASHLVPELLGTLRTLAAAYAARGDEDENQRLLAAVLHLRNADKNIGYGHGQITELEADTAEGNLQ
ncbi:hypothetical protein [Streptomyces sp. NPDC002133]|uniref:hypothetical protein n=1 Tax=Streptomyces sp. NPDC002133 TaxID=3154409 RepID=UPI00332078BB